jgi:hypothetical protein
MGMQDSFPTHLLASTSAAAAGVWGSNPQDVIKVGAL